MREKLGHIIYSFFSFIYSYFLIVFGFAMFCILGFYRFKLIDLLGSNLLSYYFSTYIFYLLLIAVFFISYKLLYKTKNRLFCKFKKYKKPTSLETYGADYKMPTFEEFGLTQKEYQKLSSKPKLNVNVMNYQKSLKIYQNIQRELFDKKMTNFNL